MPSIEDTTPSQFQAVCDRVEQAIKPATSVEDAATRFVKTLYGEYSEDMVLLRLFVTAQMQELPDRVQRFATGLAGSAGVDLEPTSNVLTLFGTAGERPEWNDLLRSEGHVGIPLATPDFVDAIPMMSALLEQLGFDLGWIRGEPEIVARAVGRMGGTFYVADAATGTDKQGRKIIAAQDFVAQYGVKTVFGFGGGYSIGSKFAVAICFLRKTISKESAIQFQRLVNIFKSETTSMVSDPNKLFR